MKENSVSILAEFDNSKLLLHGFGEVVNTLTKSLVRDTINPHQISFRIKDRDSLANKLLKKRTINITALNDKHNRFSGPKNNHLF